MKCITTFMRCGFATYESLITQLSSAHNIKAVLDLYQQHSEMFKQEHIVLALRMLGRYSRGLQYDYDYETLNELTRKVNGIVKDLNDYDVVDVLFWLRKFKTHRLNTQITKETQNELMARLKNMVENRQFSFRNMINIYYDLSLLKYNTDFLGKEITDLLPSHTKLMTPFIHNQILAAIAFKMKGSNIQNSDIQILQQCVTQLDTVIDDFDLEQKSQLFKNICEIQFQNIGPKYQLPLLVRKIKTQLLSKIESLNEESVINILRGYIHLPRYFDQELLKELKDMISTTIEQNPSNLKNTFLMSIIDTIQQFPFNRQSNALNQKVIGELAGRFERKELNFGMIIKLTQIVNRRNDTLLQALTNRIEEFSLNVHILDYLFINQVKLTSQIEQAIQLKQDKKLSFIQICHFYCYALRDHPEKAQEFQADIKEKIENQPVHVVKQFIINESNLNSLNSIQEEAYLKVIEQIKEGKLEAQKHFKDLLNGIPNVKCRSAFLEVFGSQMEQDNKSFFHKLINAIDNFNQNTISLLLLLAQKNPAKVDIFRFVQYFTNDQNKIIQLQKFDLINWIINILTQILEAQPYSVQQGRAIINFIYRFDNLGMQSNHFSQLLKGLLQSYRKDNSERVIDDISFIYQLLNYNMMNQQNAILELQQNQRLPQSLRNKLLSRAVTSEECPEDIKQQARQIFEQEYKVITQEGEDKKIQSLINILILNQGNEEELAEVRKVLATNISKLSPSIYYELTQFCQDKQVLHQLQQNFNLYINRIGVFKVIRCINKFQRWNLTSPTLYNQFLELIGDNFNFLSSEQRVNSMEVLAVGRLKQNDFFKKNFDQIIRHPSQYKFYFSNVVEYSLSLGLVEQEFREQIQKMIELRISPNESVLSKAILYLILSEAPIEQIDELANQISAFKSTTFNKDQLRFVNAFEIVKRTHPESQTCQVLKKYAESIDYSASFDKIVGAQKPKYTFFIETLSQYLKAMGVEFQVSAQIDGIQTDIYIPELNSIIQILGYYCLNYDRQTLKGNSIFTNHLFKALGKNVIQLNFREFNQQSKSIQDRVSHLNAIGIPTKNENLDLSQIQQKEVADEAETQEQQEETETPEQKE